MSQNAMCTMMWCLSLFVFIHTCKHMFVGMFTVQSLCVVLSPSMFDLSFALLSIYLYIHMPMQLLCLSNCMYDIYGGMHNTSRCSVCFYVYTHMQTNPHHLTISRQAPSPSLCIVLPLCMLCHSLSVCIIVSVQEMCLAHEKYTYVTST